MKNFGLIGTNIQSSLSPDIHMQISSLIGIDYSYKIIDTKDSKPNLKEIILSNNLSGLNVTIPYKSIMIDYIDVLEGNTNVIGATNCIRVDQNSIFATNTDTIGFEKMLSLNNIDIAGNNFIVLGSGGAASAVTHALAKNNAISITIMCRNNNGNSIKSKIGDFFEYKNLYVNKKAIPQNSILINCTPIVPYPKDILLGCKDKFSKIIDINYGQKGNYNNIEAYDGLDMLIYQAIYSVNYWFGHSIHNKVNINIIKKNIC